MGDLAVVVGVGPGLGAALVRKFAREGLTVTAVARNASKVEGLETETADGRAILADCDATDPAQMESLFAGIEAKHGPLRLAVFNAGAFARGSVLDTDPAEFERCWRVGCFAGFLTGRAAARLMQPRGEGTIIFTGATASLRGSANFVNLAAPKFGLRAVAQSMARELGPQGIHVVHAIIDGGISSPRYADLIKEKGPDSALEPDEIANTYFELHRQHRSAWTQELQLRPWLENF